MTVFRQFLQRPADFLFSLLSFWISGFLSVEGGETSFLSLMSRLVLGFVI